MFGGANIASGRHQWQGLALGVTILATVWLLTGWILADDNSDLIMATLGVTVLVIVAITLKDWRSGFYLFLVWLLFEDMARKYLGNNMAIYFGKDLLVLVTYISFYLSYRRGQVEGFRPPFLLPLTLFFWLGLVQVFNPSSPSLLYGVLGLKLYFYYVPLMFVGYALLRSEKDLNMFLMVGVALGTMIAALGIVQAIRGPDFLNPQVLAPELRTLGRLTREAPISHELVHIPTSVFVSSGRFSWYLIFVWIFTMGTLGYLLLRRGRRTKLVLLGFGIITVAAMLSGARAAVVHIGASAFVMMAGFLWGAPWRWGQGHRLAKAIRRSFAVAGLSLVLVAQFFPKVVGANWSFYSETLDPQSQKSELRYRAWDYPIRNLVGAFEFEDWPYGYGTGTRSLGVQYVSRLLGGHPAQGSVESGYGTIVLEMGILGLILWFVWTLSLVCSGWRVVRQLKATTLFPVGFAILWFAFFLLILTTYMSIGQYQNFVFNAYLWVLVGILFKLPTLAVDRVRTRPALVPHSSTRLASLPVGQ